MRSRSIAMDTATCVVLSWRSLGRFGASPYRWIVIAFRAGSHDGSNGDMRLTSRCIAQCLLLLFVFRFVHTLHTTKQDSNSSSPVGKKKRQDKTRQENKGQRTKDKGQRTKGQKDKRTKGQKDKRTKGQKDKRTKGQKDKRTKGQKDKRTKGKKEKRKKGKKEKRKKEKVRERQRWSERESW